MLVQLCNAPENMFLRNLHMEQRGCTKHATNAPRNFLTPITRVELSRIPKKAILCRHVESNAPWVEA